MQLDVTAPERASRCVTVGQGYPEDVAPARLATVAQLQVIRPWRPVHLSLSVHVPCEGVHHDVRSNGGALNFHTRPMIGEGEMAPEAVVLHASRSPEGPPGT